MEDGSLTPSVVGQPSSGTLPTPIPIPGVTTVAVKVPATTVSVPPGSSPPEEGHILIRVHVPELNVQKCLQFPRDELVWDVKQQCLAALPKELKESFNYGLFCPPVNGKAGKFLDEERRLADYPFNGPVGYLELKYKRRVYKMVNLDEKQLKALHTRANLRRLLDYVANGQVEKVAKMCSKGLDPNFHCPETGETPLTVASCTRNPSRILVALVNGGALLDFRSKDGSTAMHRAVERNSYEAVKTLLDLGASPNYRDSRGLTPLYIAVAGSHHPHGAPPPVNSSVAPHSSSSSSSSSTSSAVSSSPGPPGGGSSHHHHHHHHHHHSNHPNSVPPNNGPADAMLCEALLHDHAVLGAQDLQGWQEVHQACRNGLVQHLEHLLFYGADTEARNASGNTPLHVCAVDNRESCARLLLFRGADPNALNYANQTPYQVAVIAGNLELAEIIRNHRPENVVPFREPPRYNPKRRWSGCPPSSHPPPSSASSYAIADRPDPPLPPLPRTQSDSRLETPSGAAVNASVSRARHPPPPASIPVSSVAASTNAAGTHHHHQPPLLPQQHHHHRPPSPSPSNRSLPPFSSASSSLSEASSTGSAATGSTVTDKSLDTVSDSSGVGTSNSGGSSTGGGGTGISIHGSTGGEAVPGMTFETGTTTVVCIEDYPGTLPGHLRIVRGDVIEVTGATDCGLLEGTLHGSSGLFPTHCVQEVHLRQAAVQGIGTNRPSRVRGRRENSIKHFATAPRLKKQLPAEPRTVILHRARRGFGFVLRGAKATSPLMELTPSERCPALQYLDDVDAGGVADMAGLRKGDFLLAINDEDVSQASHEHVVDLIRRSRDLVTMTVVSGIGAGGPGSASMTGVPGAPVGSLPGPGGCRSGSQTLPSRQYSTLPRKMTGGGARTPAPMPPRRDPKTTLSVGRARARSMVAGLSEYEATSRHGRKPSSTEEGEDGEDEDDGDDDDDDEEEEEEEEEEERKRGRRRGHRDSPATVTPTPVPTPPTLPHSTSTLLRHSAKTPPLPQSPPPIPVLPPMPRTPPPGVPKTASIRSRPTSSRITAAELEELFARQGSPVEGMNGIASRGISQTIARGSPPTPKVYASVAEMKRSKDKGSRYRAGTEVLRMLHKAFHSTPDLMASKGQSSPGGRGAPKSRSQDDIPPSGLIHMNSTHQPRLYHHSWRSLERLGAPAMHTRSLPRRPGSSAPPPPTHPPPPPPVGQVVVVDVSQGDYANLDGSADANVAPISPVPAGAGVAPATPSSTSADSSTIMSSFRPAEGAKLYASPEDVKTVAYRVPSMKGDSTVRRRGSSATAAKNRSQSLPPNSTRPQVAGSSAPSEADTSVCTSFRPDSAAATPVESTAAPVAEPIRDMPPPATSASTAPGSNPYAQPYHGSPPEGKPAEYPVETKSVRYLPTGSDGSGPPIPEPDYSLSESEEGEEGSSEEESKRAVEKQPEPEAVEVTSSPPPVPPTMPETSAGGPSSPRLKDLLVQKVAERRGRLASNGSNGGSEKEEPPVDDKNDTTDGRVQSPKASATSGGLPHSFSVEEIQKVRTQLKSSKSYPSDFLLEDGDNSSSGVSSDQDVQNEHPQPQPTVTVQPVSQPETSTLTRKTKEVTRRNTQEDSKHQHQAPPQVRSAPINSIPIQITEFEDSGPERPTVVIEGTKSARSSEGGSRRREEGRRAGGTLTKNAVSLVKLPPPMETDAEGDIGSPVANTTMVPVAAPVATRPTPSATLSGPHRSSERSIEESLRLIKRHADMLNLTDFSRVVPPPPEFGGGAGLGGGRGPSARAEDDFAVLAPPPEFCDTSVDGHRTTIRVVGRKSGARSDGEGTQKVYVTKVKAKNIHHQQAQQEGRVTTVRIVGSVPKNSGQGNMNAERVCAVGENASSCVTGHHGHRPK